MGIHNLWKILLPACQTQTFTQLSVVEALPIIPIFVFDGNNQPSIKRGVKVKGKAHWLTERLQHFIEAFGFHWYTAPGEAEADLAELSSRNIIDGIVSSDGDTFVFGGRCVIRTQVVKSGTR
ncbi:PIN domain-like protein [Phlegmacium glaucopus]|nr:PIN domain-like protein [Phlegmacium glaucopus]